MSPYRRTVLSYFKKFTLWNNITHQVIIKSNAYMETVLTYSIRAIFDR